METVIADERRQRVREGVSLMASKCSENHSGVATLTEIPVKGFMYRQRCPYNVTGGITNVNKPSSFYIRDDFFVLWDKDVHKRHYPIKQKFQDYFRSKTCYCSLRAR